MSDKTFFYNEDLSPVELIDNIVGLVGSMTFDSRFKSFVKSKNDYKEIIDLDKISGRYYEFIQKFNKDLHKVKKKYNSGLKNNINELRLEIINLVAELMDSILKEHEDENSVYNKLNRIGIESANFNLPTLEYFVDELNKELFDIETAETSWWFWDRNIKKITKEDMNYIVDGKKYYVESSKDFIKFNLKLKGMEI